MRKTKPTKYGHRCTTSNNHEHTNLVRAENPSMQVKRHVGTHG